jgi:hypothetical protein
MTPWPSHPFSLDFLAFLLIQLTKNFLLCQDPASGIQWLHGDFIDRRDRLIFAQEDGVGMAFIAVGDKPSGEHSRYPEEMAAVAAAGLIPQRIIV